MNRIFTILLLFACLNLNGQFFRTHNFNSGSGLPTVTTGILTSISGTLVQAGGNVVYEGGSSVTARGVVWGTSINPTIGGNSTTNGSGTGSYTSYASGTNLQTLYFRAYATNSNGTSYGITRSVQVGGSGATLTTTTPSSIGNSTAVVGGDITASGGATVTERGVVYSTSPNPTTSSNKTVVGEEIGSYSTTISGLNPNTTYYVRSYAISSVGTVYGSQQSFTTTGSPTVITGDTYNIGWYTIYTVCNVTSDNGHAITSRGTVWGTSANPTTSDNVITHGSGTGPTYTYIYGLTSGATYHVRAFATNSDGTTYGNDISITTNNNPFIETISISSVTSNSVTITGIITGDAGWTYTQGFTWCLQSRGHNPWPYNNSNPAVEGYWQKPGWGSVGVYSTTITGLSSNSAYYIRSYWDVSGIGVGFGTEISFTTNP
jgi:hypothetical protein